MITESQVQAKLGSLLVGTIDLEQFHEWLVAHSYDMHLDSSPEARRLVNSVYGPVHEYGDGLISEQELMTELVDLLSVSLGIVYRRT